MILGNLYNISELQFLYMSNKVIIYAKFFFPLVSDWYSSIYLSLNPSLSISDWEHRKKFLDLKIMKPLLDIAIVQCLWVALLICLGLNASPERYKAPEVMLCGCASGSVRICCKGWHKIVSLNFFRYLG